MIVCDRCYGQGGFNCAQCGGKGKREDDRLCMACSATGRVLCSKCHGTGQVMSINIDNVRLWIQALESGEYGQIQGSLVNVDESRPEPALGFCCMGVACEVAQRNGVKISRKSFQYQWTDDRGPHAESGVLPLPVMQWLGIEWPNPQLKTTDYGMVNASALNDVHEMDFPRIAALLRSTYGIED